MVTLMCSDVSIGLGVSLLFQILSWWLTPRLRLRNPDSITKNLETRVCGFFLIDGGHTMTSYLRRTKNLSTNSYLKWKIITNNMKSEARREPNAKLPWQALAARSGLPTQNKLGRAKPHLESLYKAGPGASRRHDSESTGTGWDVLDSPTRTD